MIHALIAAPFGEISDPDTMKTLIDDAGPVAFFFVVTLGIVLFFLGRSLVRQVKKVNPDLPPGPKDAMQAADRQMILNAMDRGAQEAAVREASIDADPAPTSDPGDAART